MDTVQQAFNKTKIALMSRADSAFFTTICFSLKHEWDDSIKTAATDGSSIFFNPEFFMSLDVEERVFLLLHEAMHCAFLHMDRLQTRDRAKFNVAADHVINLMLIERGFRMPKVGLADPQYQGMSTEEVYKILPEQDKTQVDCDLLEPSEGEAGQLQQAMEDILVRASIQSKMQGDNPGTIPGEIEISLNGLLNPKLPWYRILQKYLQALAKNDYTFRKPNRRFFPKYHLPSLFGEKMINLAIAVDTSGSVSDEEFKSFVSEIHSILRMMKPEKITLIQFDTAIRSVNEIRNIHELSKVCFMGRGGTQIGPVIDWVNEHKPQLLLTFSDGEFNFRGTKTKAPSIWVIHNNESFTAPFGKTIHYAI